MHLRHEPISYQYERFNYVFHCYTIRRKYHPIMVTCSKEFRFLIGWTTWRLLVPLMNLDLLLPHFVHLDSSMIHGCVIIYFFISKSPITFCLVLLSDLFIDSGICLISQPYHWYQVFSPIFNFSSSSTSSSSLVLGLDIGMHAVGVVNIFSSCCLDVYS